MGKNIFKYFIFWTYLAPVLYNYRWHMGKSVCVGDALHWKVVCTPLLTNTRTNFNGVYYVVRIFSLLRLTRPLSSPNVMARPHKLNENILTSAQKYLGTQMYKQRHTQTLRHTHPQMKIQQKARTRKLHCIHTQTTF